MNRPDEEEEKRGRTEENAPRETAKAESKISVSEAETVAPSVQQTAPKAADDSAAVMAGLDPVSCRIFAQMPIDRAVSPDQMALPDVAISELMTSLT